jgi:tRNA(fMet)-specific endonuclease VapC
LRGVAGSVLCMAQVTIYLPDDVEGKARSAAKAENKSVSRWIAEQLVHNLEETLPQAVFNAAGAVPDFPDVAQLRSGYGSDARRKPIEWSCSIPVRSFIISEARTWWFKGSSGVRVHELRIPSVVAHEFTYGVLKICLARHRAVTSALLEGIVQIPFDTGAAGEAAHIRVELESRGLTIGPMDLLIAATAVSRGAVLATCNTDEFCRVKGLKIIDWTKPNPPTHRLSRARTWRCCSSVPAKDIPEAAETVTSATALYIVSLHVPRHLLPNWDGSRTFQDRVISTSHRLFYRLFTCNSNQIRFGGSLARKK